MSNTRYVRILPSAVDSKVGQWYGHHIGAVLPVHHMNKHNDIEVYILSSPMYPTNTYMIEVYHTKEVYVYDEPREAFDENALYNEIVRRHRIIISEHDGMVRETMINNIVDGLENFVTKQADAELPCPSQPTAKPMKVRVVKAGKGSWYETQVGEEFNVLEERKSDYIVEKVGDTWYHIDKSDCEIVTEPEPDRIAELEARVKALEEKQEVTHRLAAQAVLGGQPAPYHEVKHDVEAQIGKTQPQRDHVKAESNLERAKRLYYKGVKFKSIGTVAHTIVSSGQFVQDDRGIYDKNESFYVNLGGAWAEIVSESESNLDKAKRLYPKGTRFKTLGTVAHTVVSSGEFQEAKRGVYDSNTKHYVLLDGQWAEIVQDEPAQKIDLIKEYLEPTGITITELMDRNAFASLCQLLDAYLLESVRNSR